MTLRTIPNSLPILRLREVFTRKRWSSPLSRKIAQAHNFVWSNFIRVYANSGYEGHGNILRHLGNAATSNINQNPNWLETLPNGTTNALCCCSFIVPPNWCAGARVKIRARYAFANSGTSSAGIFAVLCDLDENPTGDMVQLADIHAAATTDATGYLVVPQDKTYQIKIYITFVDSSVAAEVGGADQIKLIAVSARYETSQASDLNGDTPPTLWLPIADSSVNASYSVDAAHLKRLAQNYQYMISQRPPEICQSYLDVPYHNGAAFTEVGRYTVWMPGNTVNVAGKLVVNCTHGGAGNEVRVLLGGVIQQTFVALAAGINELAVTAFAAGPGLGAGAEKLITIEAKSTAGATDWGTVVLGASFWEDSVNLNLPAGMAVPSAYAPLDEEGLEGDDVVVQNLNSIGQRSGLLALLKNDVWLARHRLRHLVGDWRHHVFKGLGNGVGGTEERATWAMSDVAVAPANNYRPKNISIMATAATKLADGYGHFTDGFGVATGWQLNGPYKYPTALVYTGTAPVGAHGARLAKFWAVRPTGTTSHINEGSSDVNVLVRCRRLQPYKMSTDSNGLGPTPQEYLYLNMATVDVYKDGALSFAIGIQNPDTSPRWRGPVKTGWSNADHYLEMSGRLIPPASTVEAEGLLFEVEGLGFYVADFPLPTSWLTSL